VKIRTELGEHIGDSGYQYVEFYFGGIAIGAGHMALNSSDDFELYLLNGSVRRGENGLVVDFSRRQP
jgi:hypothetical protein